MKVKLDISIKKEIKRLLFCDIKNYEIASLLKVSTGLVNCVKFNRKHSAKNKNTDSELMAYEAELRYKYFNIQSDNNYNNINISSINNAGMTGLSLENSPGNDIPCSILELISNNNNIPNPLLTKRSDNPKTSSKTLTIDNISSDTLSLEKNATLNKKLHNIMKNIKEITFPVKSMITRQEYRMAI